MDIKKEDIRVIVINMHKDTHKFDRMQDMLRGQGFTHIEFIDAVDAEFIGDTQFNAISMSHEMAIKIATWYDFPFLILEDDCLINLEIPDVITVPDDAHAVYLGHSVAGVSSVPIIVDDPTFASITTNASIEQYSEDMYKINSMVGAHAILYLSEDFKKAAHAIAHAAYNKSINHDIMFAFLQLVYNVYGFSIPYFIQTSQYQLTKDVLRGTKD